MANEKHSSTFATSLHTLYTLHHQSIDVWYLSVTSQYLAFS